MSIHELLHKRVLVAKKENTYSNKLASEIKVLQISPSSNWVKINENNMDKYDLITPADIVAIIIILFIIWHIFN